MNQYLKVNEIKLSKGLQIPDAIGKYLTHLRALNYASNTIYCYSKDLHYLQEHFGNIFLSRITEESLDLFLIKIQNSKISSSSKGNNTRLRSLSTINRIKIVYRSFFQWCFRKGYLQNDFLSNLTLIKNNPRPTVPITREETAHLLKTISESNDNLAFRDKVLFSIYAFSGIRRAEALALRICDYDCYASIIYLPKSKRSNKKFQIIPAVLSMILDKYLNKNFNLKDTNDSLPLFPGTNANISLSCRQASNRFEKWKRITGIRKNLTIHSFRSGYASQLYNNCKDLLLVSYALGHCSSNTTSKYIALDVFNISDILENTFCKVKNK